MRKRAGLFILALLIVVPSHAGLPHAGWFGGGLVVGDPLGPTARFWTRSTRSIDAGVGFESDPTVYADYLWQAWNTGQKPQGGNWGGYVGVGPRFQARDHEDDTLGVRVPFGVNWFFDRQPIELFGEIVPVFQVSPKLDTDIDAGVGVRVYFIP